MVLDSIDAVDATQDFLRHLLVIVGADSATQHHAALLGLEADAAAGKVGALPQGSIDQATEFGSGSSEGRHGGWCDLRVS